MVPVSSFPMCHIGEQSKIDILISRISADFICKYDYCTPADWSAHEILSPMQPLNNSEEGREVNSCSLKAL
jgi:hypothetical protein